jgi:exopolysaccharide production protein ExoZ
MVRTAARLTGIEASRGIAAAIVVIYHVARHLDKNYGMPALKGTFQFGHAGVDLFFVISGFIILHVHYRDIGHPARLGNYLRRRFTRVMPIYWVALALTVLMGLGEGLPSFSDLAWSITLLPSNSALILDIAWTLRHEIVFYALFCTLILNPVAGIAIFGLWFASIVLGSLTGFRADWLPGVLHGNFNLGFFFGMAAAYALRRGWVAAPRPILLVGVALFAAAAVAEDLALFNGFGDAGRIIYGLPAALIVLGTASADGAASITVPHFARVLGAASYSIYLFQFVFIGTLWKLWLATGLDSMMPHAASFPLLAIGGVAGGIVVSRLIEYPLIRLIRGDRTRIPLHSTVA